MKVSDLFNLSDFASKDGGDFTEEALENIPKIAEQLDVVSKHFGKKININSAFRTVAHNARVKGGKNSFHLKGMAVDIWIEGVTPRALHGQMQMLMTAGKITKGGLGLYNTFVHYDIRGTYFPFDKQTKKSK